MKKKKKAVRIIFTILGICLMLVGIAIPLKTYVDYRIEVNGRKELKKEFDQLVEANKAKKAAEEKNASDPKLAPALTEESHNERSDVALNELPGDDEPEIELVYSDVPTLVHKKPTATPTPKPDMPWDKDPSLIVAQLSIPSIDISYIVIEGTEMWCMQHSLAHFEETAWPGEEGNFSVIGHRGGKYGEFFKYLNEVEIGDEVIVDDIYGNTYTYIVTESFVIEPTEWWVIDPKEGKEITLITCTDNGKRRMAVKGILDESKTIVSTSGKFETASN